MLAVFQSLQLFACFTKSPLAVLEEINGFPEVFFAEIGPHFFGEM